MDASVFRILFGRLKTRAAGVKVWFLIWLVAIVLHNTRRIPVKYNGILYRICEAENISFGSLPFKRRDRILVSLKFFAICQAFQEKKIHFKYRIILIKKIILVPTLSRFA